MGERDLRIEFLRLKAALYDPNTQISSLPAACDRVRALFDSSRWVGLIHVEVDSLSALETIYGWQVMDRFLKVISELLRGALGEILPADSILAQGGIYGGRFLIFSPLNGTSVAPIEALERASAGLQERLAERFRSPDFESMSPEPAFRLGYSSFTNQPFFRMERLIYRAVEEARAIGLLADPRGKTRAYAELKRIIEDGDVDVLFQPVVDVRTSEVLGYEALSRGPRDTAFEKPMAMFTCSREAGIDLELDFMCHKAALARAMEVPAGRKLFLNALPASLMDPGFRDLLLEDLPADFPVAAEDIVIEIADRDAIEDFEQFGTQVGELRSRGIRLAVDDVGTGSGTLQTIAEIRPDYIKIDGSLIRDAERSLVKQEMLRSLLQVAHSIDAAVVAEGIESESELQIVKNCGIEYGQGYLFAPPGRDVIAADGG